MNYRWMVIKIAFMDSHLVEQGNEIHEPTKNWDGKWVTHAFMSRFFPTQKRSHLAKPWSCRIRRQKVAEPKYMLFFIFTISNLNGKPTWFFHLCTILWSQDLLRVTRNDPCQWMIWILCVNSLGGIVSANSKAPREISLHASGHLVLCLFLDVLETGGLRSKSCTSWIRID